MDWNIPRQFFIFIGFAAASFAIMGWFLYDIRKKVRGMFAESDGSETNLPRDLIRRVARMETKIEEWGPRLDQAERIAAISVQKVGFLRFNPFQDMGGDNSFIIALLDRGDNGVILSSLAMRGGTRMFAKEIRRGAAQTPLSAEEKKVLERALHIL